MNVEDIRDNKALIEHLEAGNEVDFFFFYGHSIPEDGSVSKSCLSQWYPASFKIGDTVYKTAEHFMMAEKARIFGDEEMLEEIINSSHPKEAKALGRKVSNFDQDRWLMCRFDIVITGNLAKFSQNKKLKDFLLDTADSVIVEASPRDRIWGIGMSQKNQSVEDPRKWRGQNLLGYGLMEVRSRLI